jgi:hypothetical protein
MLTSAMSKIFAPLFAAAVLCIGPGAPSRAQHPSRVLRTAEYWNTWSANRVLAHVYLPDGFALTLGLKSAGMGHSYQNTFSQANASLRPAGKGSPPLSRVATQCSSLQRFRRPSAKWMSSEESNYRFLSSRIALTTNLLPELTVIVFPHDFSAVVMSILWSPGGRTSTAGVLPKNFPSI